MLRPVLATCTTEHKQDINYCVASSHIRNTCLSYFGGYFSAGSMCCMLSSVLFIEGKLGSH